MIILIYNAGRFIIARPIAVCYSLSTEQEPNRVEIITSKYGSEGLTSRWY